MYASTNCLCFYEQSRRDDLESLGYMLVRFCKKSLPWSDLPMVGEMTISETLSLRFKARVLCNGLHTAFWKYLHYTQCLAFYQDPDYETLKQDFRKSLEEDKSESGYTFDWMCIPKKDESISSTSQKEEPKLSGRRRRAEAAKSDSKKKKTEIRKFKKE